MKLRVGNGYDTHPLLKGESLILGGINIPSEKGTKGHSDGDVLAHAIIDSLLGAMAFGDIGQLFPSSKIEYKKISSMQLLKKVMITFKQKKYKIANIDTTIILEEPTLKNYITLIKESIASCLEIKLDQLSVKATTNDKLGFIGEGKGISVLATTLITI